MKIQDNGTYTGNYYVWERKLHQPYDYEHNGLVNRILSHKIHDTSNPFLKYMVDVYERSLVYCMKYIDMLANFINYNKWNR